MQDTIQKCETSNFEMTIGAKIPLKKQQFGLASEDLRHILANPYFNRSPNVLGRPDLAPNIYYQIDR